MSDDQLTRELKAVKRERRKAQRQRVSEWGLDIIIIGLIMFVAGFVVALALVSAHVIGVHHHH